MVNFGMPKNEPQVHQVETEEGDKRFQSIELPGGVGEFFYIRHSLALYKDHGRALNSDNPQQSYDIENQSYDDLSDAGKELARNEAEKFFDALNPETDELFFVSSNISRALGTADIYRQVAHERGFKIITHKNVRGTLAQEIGEGEIRVLKNLSINVDNMLLASVFTPDEQLGEINWEAVDEDFKVKWEKAREIINSADEKSWGANFEKHSEEIKKIFSDLKSSKDLYDTQFKNLMELIRFGDKKIRESKTRSNVKVLGFGHENAIGHAIKEIFGSTGIKNCEPIKAKVNDGKIVLERRGEEKFQETKKPEILYHGSANRGIVKFEPRSESVRSGNEGDVVFATPDKALASIFLVPSNDSWTQISRFDSKYHIIISDEERYKKLDTGGVIYGLPCNSFETNMNKGMGDREWTSKESVEPIEQEEYESGLRAMIDNDVQVYFVDRETFEKIKTADDHGISIIRTLEAEK